MIALEQDESLRGRVRVRPYPGRTPSMSRSSFWPSMKAVTARWCRPGVSTPRTTSATPARQDVRVARLRAPCERRFLALPEHRARAVGYVDDLTAELEGRVHGIEVVTENKLLSMVAKVAGRLCDQ